MKTRSYFSTQFYEGGVKLMQRQSSLNKFDVERISRENIYNLEEENFRITDLVQTMIEQKIPITIITGWLRQMEDNAAEVIYTSSLIHRNNSM